MCCVTRERINSRALHPAPDRACMCWERLCRNKNRKITSAQRKVLGKERSKGTKTRLFPPGKTRNSQGASVACRDILRCGVSVRPTATQSTTNHAYTRAPAMSIHSTTWRPNISTESDPVSKERCRSPQISRSNIGQSSVSYQFRNALSLDAMLRG
jgi:hypothetical protein